MQVLREIVAEVVIKRAKLISRYESADDAFDSEQKEGFYRLRNDQINDCGMVVASTNIDALKELVLALRLDDVDLSILLEGDALPTVTPLEEAGSLYRKTREEFVRQYFRVAGMRDEIASEQDEVIHLLKVAKNYLSQGEMQGSLPGICRLLKEKLTNEMIKGEQALSSAEKEKEDLLQDIEGQKTLLQLYRQAADKALDSINLKTKLLNRAGYDQAIRQRDESMAKQEEAEKERRQLEGAY
jgi:hypothetical protein